jgi:hypothetical protein
MQWYIMIIASLWLCLPDVTCWGAGPSVSPHGLKELQAQNVESGENRGIFFSQNDKKMTADDVTEGSSVEDEEKEIKREPSEREKKAEEASKALKPFVPSETIPAEQGVDFPYDI